MLSFDFIHRASNGSSLDIETKDFRLICSIADQNLENWSEYNQNSCSIPKGKRILFKIAYKGREYHRQSNETIEWEIHNRGEEAKVKSESEIGPTCKNEVNCGTHAAYLGHHYMLCKITRPFGSNIKLTFPIYVQ